MNLRGIITLIFLAMIQAGSLFAAEKPNIVFILCDDLGYGDVHCLNPERGKIPTPCLDKFAGEGITFTDAHSSSSVCTPTRYGLLTGRYNWRTRLQRGVFLGYEEPLIAAERLTVPALLKQEGYATACIGKWHLGWNWPKDDEAIDYAKPLADGPTTRGFDYYFGTHVPNQPPYCFIENDRTIGIPSEPLAKEFLRMVQGPGLAVPGYKLEAILPTLTAKACDYISHQAKGESPYFLYLALTSPHTPIAVTEEWQGKSGLGAYADFVMETDAMIGRVLAAIERSGKAQKTLVFIASDNGCAPFNIKPMEKQGHFPSGEFRGCKTDAWDGGHHIPFLVRWPGQIKPGSHCDKLVCLNDLMATCADILDTKLPENAGEDSVSILPLLRSEDRVVRESLVHHSLPGQFAIREGQWKLLLCAGSGGASQPTDVAAAKQDLPTVQLYHLTVDAGEQKNLQAEHPEIVQRLTKLLEKTIADGRSTPGATQKNDGVIVIRKPLGGPGREERITK